MKLCVIGTGYVGLVCGACFAEMGNEVVCVDVDSAKIRDLRAGRIPIYEPGLKEKVDRNTLAGRLNFTTNFPEAVGCSLFCFIAVGTPESSDGSAYVDMVLDVAREIARIMEDTKIVVTKSTVPVGTADRIRRVMSEVLDARGVHVPFSVASNPEFLKEGAAVEDFMKPERIIIGCDDPTVEALLCDLYAPFTRTRDRILVMDIHSAEMTKYAANAMLATRISFMNEMAAICEAVQADISSVRKGIGSDPRIGAKFLFPGAGYGGSCFPKDMRALIRMAEDVGLKPRVLQAVEDVNERQKQVLFQKAVAYYGSENLRGKRFAVWGLAFKPNTDDIREAPSLNLIESLLEAGAHVCVYDPAAMDAGRKRLGERVAYAPDQYACLEGADALFLVTEWNEFREPNFDRIHRLMAAPVVFDGRNQYDSRRMRDRGFSYFGIGKSSSP